MFVGFGILCNLENPLEMSDDYGFRPRKGFGKDGEPMGNRWGTAGERGGNRGVFLGNLIFPHKENMVFHALEGS